MPQKRFQKKIDYIVVGQGIAGTMLSYRLLKRGKKVLVIDNNPPFSSSKVSAGIINYITGRRFVKTWLADTIIPFAAQLYQDMEVQLEERFYYPSDIYKPIFTAEEHAEIKGVVEKKKLQGGLSFEMPLENDFLKPHKAAVVVHKAGYVNVKGLLLAWHRYLQVQNCLLEEEFDHTVLGLTDGHAEYKGYRAEKLIFCEGYRVLNNPYFKDLPLVTAHGDILTIRVSGGADFDQIISKGIYVVPLGEDLYKAGATYLWNTMDPSPTENGKQDLLDKLDKLLGFPFEIIAHEAGIRPTVEDRRPLLGTHSQHPQLAVFNGMGTKGVTLAPYLALHFTEHLVDNKPLMEEVNISRRFANAKQS